MCTLTRIFLRRQVSHADRFAPLTRTGSGGAVPVDNSGAGTEVAGSADGRGASRAATAASSLLRASLDGANVDEDAADGTDADVNITWMACGADEEKNRKGDAETERGVGGW